MRLLRQLTVQSVHYFQIEIENEETNSNYLVNIAHAI